MGAVGLFMPTPGHAAGVQVEFDVPSVVAVSRVPIDDPMLPAGGGELIEVWVIVSVRVTSGDPDSVDEVRFELHQPAGRLRVADLAPRTTLATEFAEPITLATTREKLRGGGAKIGAGLALPQSEIVGSISPGIDLHRSEKSIQTETIRRLPPQRARVVSGTLAGGQGVFFTFRRSPQDTLEGTHELVVQWTASDTWRAEWLVVSCQAQATQSTLFGSAVETVGTAKRLVGLFATGHIEASAACQRLASAQRRWLNRRAGSSSGANRGGPWSLAVFSSNRGSRNLPDWRSLAEVDLAEPDVVLIQQWLGGRPQSDSDQALAQLIGAHLALERLAR